MGNITQTAYDALHASLLGQTPLLTDLVLGTPTNTVQVARGGILKNISAPYEFSYRTIGKERLRRIDTRRNMRQPFGTSDYTYSTSTAKLVRYGHAGEADRDEIAIASNLLRMTEMKYYQARMAVELNIEQVAADLLTTTTNYPATHRLAIGAGSEWDAAGGDSLANVQSMLAVIEDDTGLSRQDLTIFLGAQSARAALSDPVFLARRVYTSGANAPTASALADYWGVGKVWSANPVTAEEDGTITRMYSDVAIIYYDGGPTVQQYEDKSLVGDLVFGVNFTFNRGVVQPAFYEERNTTWMFPWENWSLPKILNSYAGAIITNCAA